MGDLFKKVANALPTGQELVGAEFTNAIVDLFCAEGQRKSLDSKEPNLAFDTIIRWHPSKFAMFDANSTHLFVHTTEEIESETTKTILWRDMTAAVDSPVLEKEFQTLENKTLGTNNKYTSDIDANDNNIINLHGIKVHDVDDNDVLFLEITNTSPNSHFDILTGYNSTNFEDIAAATDIKFRIGFDSEIDIYQIYSKANGGVNKKLLEITPVLLDINTDTVDFHDATINNISLSSEQIPSNIAYEDEQNLFTQIQKIQHSGSALLTLYREINTLFNGAGLLFNLQNDLGDETNYAAIYGLILDNPAGDEDAYITFNAKTAGVLRERAILLDHKFGITNAIGARGQLDPVNLTGHRTLTMQNVNGTLALLESAQTFTAQQRMKYDASQQNLTLIRGVNSAGSGTGTYYRLFNSLSSESTYAYIIGAIGSNASDNEAGAENGQIYIGLKSAGIDTLKVQITKDWFLLNNLQATLTHNIEESLVLRRLTNTVGARASMLFQLQDNVGVNTSYAKIGTRIGVNTNGNETGYLDFFTMKNGTLVECMVLDENQLSLGLVAARAVLDASLISGGSKTHKFPNRDGIVLVHDDTDTLLSGDILYFDGTNIRRLGIGTDGQIIKAASGLPSWSNEATASIAFDDLTDVNAPTPAAGDVPTWDDVNGEWISAAPPGAGGGESNDLVTVGSGQGDIRKTKVGSNIHVKSLLQGTGIGITNNVDDITIGVNSNVPLKDVSNIFSASQQLETTDFNILTIYRKVNVTGSANIRFYLQNADSIAKTFGSYGIRSDTVTVGDETGSFRVSLIDHGTDNIEQLKIHDGKMWIGKSGGARAIFDPSNMTSFDKTFTLPDNTGQIATLNYANLFTTLQKIQYGFTAALTLYRNESTQNVGTGIAFDLQNDSNQEVSFAQIFATNVLNDAGVENGALGFHVRSGGTIAERMLLDHLNRLRIGLSGQGAYLDPSNISGSSKVFGFPNESGELVIGSDNRLSLRTSRLLVNTTPVTLDDQTEQTIHVDATGGNIVVNLPAASGRDGQVFFIQKIDSSSNTVTIDGNATETINGSETYVLTAQYQIIMLLCDGSNWTTGPYSTERRGKSTADGDGSATVFNIDHGLGVNPHDVIVSCRTHTIASYTVDDTHIIVTLTSAPDSGSGNVIFDWSAVP